MARIRCIKPEFWRHPILGRLPDDQQLLALALLSMADDEGYFRAEPELIRGDVQPFRDDLATISRGLARLSEVGWIEVVNHVEQGSIGRIKTWAAHQKVDHPKDSKLKRYFIRDDVANLSRSTCESVVLEQGSGNRDQGTENGNAAPPQTATTEPVYSPPENPNGKSQTPCGLTQLEYARKLLEDLGLPSTGNLVLVADSISADAKKHGIMKAQSYEFIRRQALTDQKEGVEINRFYWTDAKFRRVANQRKPVVPGQDLLTRTMAQLEAK